MKIKSVITKTLGKRKTNNICQNMTFCILTNASYPHKRSQRRQPVWCAPSAEPSRNLGKSVVVVAEVLGFETAEVVVTPSSITRGTGASGSAKHGRSPRQHSATSQMLINKKVLPLLMVLQQISKQ